MKGKTTIVIDPRRTEIARYATHHLQLKPGTNVALLNMMLYYIASSGLEDKKFIESRTEGYDDFKKQILSLDIDQMEKITGVDRNLVKAAAIAYAKAPNAMSYHGLGVTEHSQGSYTVMLISDLAMITGNIGRRGVGVNPLRGQNNVQGAADMGCQPHQGAGYLDSYDPEINKLYESFYGRKIPVGKGLKIPEMYDSSIAGNLKAMWLMGEDLVQTDPNTSVVIAAMKNLELLVVQEIFMTETCHYAHVILPAATFFEKSGTFTNGERRIQRVQKVVEPIAGTKSDGDIMVDILNKMGYPQPAYDPDTMLQEISKIVPFFAGVTWDNLAENGKQWPVLPDGSDTEILHIDTFKRGLGKFHYFDWKESEELVKNGKQYPYIVTTNRELEHYNAGTMTRRTGNVDILTEDVILIHPDDAATHFIEEGDMVCVESPRGKVDIKARLTDEVKPGVLSTTFHFPELTLNIITSSERDSEAMCPEYKIVAVNIRKSKGKYKEKV
jgi:formate dehydrogenase major subunit